MSGRFHVSWRVRFDEVDLQGVVHHTNIVTYLEIARVEFWRQLGISYKTMRSEGYEFIINGVNVEYASPLTFDEIIDVYVEVKSIKRASFILKYEIYNQQGERAIFAETGLLCSRIGTGKPCGLPRKYLELLKNPDL
ncbi:MAG: acyl-CoA thioesterase [Candidatus Zixiibacteriota bacterium]|nr:MAG: acyl-CoA thioesterase [candidate division Zixibacteria bacterium]